MGVIRIDRELCLDAEKERLVEAGSEESAFTWGVAGEEKSQAECERLGYEPDPEITKAAKAAEKEAKAVEAKEAKESKAAENKEKKPAANKGGGKPKKKGGK